MLKRALSLTAGVALALAAQSGSAAAQGVSITPFIGYYAPLGDVIDEGGSTVSTQAALAFGGRLTLDVPGPLGVEASVAYAGAGVESGGSEGDANVMVLSARALFQLASLGPMASLHAGAGLAYVMRGGDVWDEAEDFGVDGINDFGGTLGLGAKFGLGPMFSIRVDLEDFIYSAKFEDTVSETEGKLQNDLLLSAGLNIGF
jgi:hypothetical protein